jgi:hypothetical protein
LILGLAYLLLVTDFLESQNADLLILQEVDLNARRTRRLDIAKEIGRRLRLNYVFGREFEELTQGSRTSPAHHGQATLSRWRLANSRVIRFRRQSGFWRPAGCREVRASVTNLIGWRSEVRCFGWPCSHRHQCFRSLSSLVHDQVLLSSS